MRLLFLLICCLLVGCASIKSDKIYSFTPLSNPQIENLMIRTNKILVPFFKVDSSQYAAPTTDWVKEKFSPALRDFYFYHNSIKYRLWENDCVKYSVHGLSVGYDLYHHDKDRLIGKCLAIGICDLWTGEFTDEGFLGHELLFFIVNDGKGFKLVFYEPQAQDFREIDTGFVIYWGM